MSCSKYQSFSLLIFFGVLTTLYVLIDQQINEGTKQSGFLEFLSIPSRSALIKYKNIFSRKWIVVTTVSDPTADIRYLSKIPGWKVVVVGDTKTPKNWSLTNCIFLSLEDQNNLGLSSSYQLPEKSYSRKNIGYLFAIAHGARIIYETDDDNRPTDMLRKFILEPTMWGLLYNGSTLFNPYRHFGQPTLWPRGYPLSAVGENFTTNYELNHFKTPSIQQGIVNGDPDMDAIFRLTRKKTTSVLNVTFDGRAPPAIVPWGVFSPFNSQNTLFLYDALWAMMIPTTTAFRVCDIWRGYWAQRLLWEMGGNLGFFPPNAFQKRNSHSYLLDAMDETDLYFKTGKLVKFLQNWTCDDENTFYGCMVQLSGDMFSQGYWMDGDKDLTIKWVNDLQVIGYKEPKRIDFRNYVIRVKTIDRKPLPGQDKSLDGTSAVRFWAVEQKPPLKYSKETIDRMLQHIVQISRFCNNSFVNTSLSLSAKPVKTFPNILLIIVFNFPHYENVEFLEAMYSFHFPHIVYCGEETSKFDNHTKDLKHLTFIDASVKGGWLSQQCLIQAMKMKYNVDGFLYIGDDTLLNVWNVHTLPIDQLWIKEDSILRQSGNTSWHWFHNPRVGLTRYQVAVNNSMFIKPKRFERFFKMLKRNTGFEDGLYKATSDIVYVPQRLQEKVLFFLEHFTKFNLFVEIAIPTVLCGVEKWERVHKLKGKYLWYDGKREKFQEYFDKHDIFLHPVKIGYILKTEIGRKFYCDVYLPLTTRGGLT